jgi:hypothetical protein
MNICIDIRDQSEEGNACYNLGLIYYLCNDGVKAAKFLEKAIRCCIGRYAMLFRFLHDVATIWMKGRREHRSPLKWSPFIVIG